MSFLKIYVKQGVEISYFLEKYLQSLSWISVSINQDINIYCRGNFKGRFSSDIRILTHITSSTSDLNLIRKLILKICGVEPGIS